MSSFVVINRSTCGLWVYLFVGIELQVIENYELFESCWDVDGKNVVTKANSGT